eukprot:GGOE01026025.1.p1 GENE.GGOE01026025.1~~GGOE01026025.1.p1  ORF type:complete len:553 (-),score=23.66 GGOE01026025.1:293-1951(-)
MALTSRSKRDTDLACSNLPEAIGPGSYDPAPLKKPLSGQAPFGSTTHRVRPGSDNLVTPGPGAYAPVEKGDEQKAPSFMFASKSSRMSGEVGMPKKAPTPGPGSYNLPGSIRSKPNTPAVFEPNITKAVNWVKVSTAPSIPTILQSFGYEEGPGGALVQQKPPSSGFAGNHVDSVGPGYYEVDSSLVTKSRSTAFGKGKTKRDCLGLSRDALCFPGPGTYNPDSVETDEVVRPSYIFLSSSSRDKPSKGKNRSLTPGPGSYQSAKLWRTAEDFGGRIPEGMQAFGSTSRKLFQPLAEQHPVPVHNADTPGPGAYDVHSKAVVARDRLAVMEETSVPHGAFDTTAPRFLSSQEVQRDTPGPGYYTSGKDGVSANLQKKVAGRFGVFGTTSQRFPLPRDESLGPGLYDPKIGLGMDNAKLRKKDLRSAVFASRTRRENASAMPSADCAPPVGAYDVPNPEWLKKSVNCSSTVLAGAPRFKAQKPADTPGPGAYGASTALGEKNGEQDEQNSAMKPRNISKSPRFPREVVNSVPGPGAYNADVSLLKRTFNVTIG